MVSPSFQLLFNYEIKKTTKKSDIQNKIWVCITQAVSAEAI